jgi:hypothetical protein
MYRSDCLPTARICDISKVSWRRSDIQTSVSDAPTTPVSPFTALLLGWLAASQITCPASIQLVPTMPASPTPSCPGWARHITRATWRRPLTWSSPRRHPSLPNALDGPVTLPGLPAGVPRPGPHEAGIPHPLMPWMGPSHCPGYLAASLGLVLTRPASPTTEWPGWAHQIARATWRRPLA